LEYRRAPLAERAIIVDDEDAQPRAFVGHGGGTAVGEKWIGHGDMAAGVQRITDEMTTGSGTGNDATAALSQHSMRFGNNSASMGV
jgi:hypothetical protein